VSKVIETSLKNGANTVNNIQFYVKDKQMLEKQGLSLVKLPRISGHLEKPGLYGRQEVFRCQRKRERATPANSRWRLYAW
jgi:hypothetical protein